MVSPKHLLKFYVFACKAQALQTIKKHPDRFEHVPFIVRALRETPSIPQLYHVQRRKERRRVRSWIESNNPAPPINPTTATENEGD